MRYRDYFLTMVLAGLMMLTLTNTGFSESVRTLPPGPPKGTPLAPGYCPSYGGSTLYEYIQSVSIAQNPGGTITITVNIWIANPTGCTAGNPCPEYDNSPEYINAWIDWDGDEVFESSERVMDEALTGYLGINYHGTMTGVSTVTIPPNVVGSTWMRVNLGWGYDPNDPCEESWVWGDVLDKQVEFDLVVRLLKLEAVDNIEIEGFSDVIWEQEFNNQTECNLTDVEVSAKPIAAPFTKGAFGVELTVGYCPSQPSWDPMIIFKYSIPEANISEEITSWGWQRRFNVLLPQKVGKYTLNLEPRIYDEDQSNLLHEPSIPSRTLYVTYDNPKLKLSLLPLKQIWLDAATQWAQGAINDFDVASKLNDYIYGPALWTYNPGLGFYPGVWQEFVEGTRTVGHCMFFAETWSAVGKILGIAADYTWYDAKKFITTTPADALDGQTGNIWNGITDIQDRWRFDMHSFGIYPLGTNSYYDPTFGKTYTDPEQYIQWYYAGPIIVWIFPWFQIVGERHEKGAEYVNLYTQNYESYLAWHYYGPFEDLAPPGGAEPLPLYASVGGSPVGLSKSANGVGFTGNYLDQAIDTDGDGRYNQLSVTIEVNVTDLGRYFLDGAVTIGDTLITDRSDPWMVLPAVYEVGSELGLDTVVFTFCGEDIYQKGYDGEYTFHFSLTDTNYNLVDAFQFSAVYNHSQFGEIPAQISGIVDQGIDSDVNGLYDFLEIEVSVSVDVASNYSVLGVLSANDIPIGETHLSSHLDTGTNSLLLQFTGTDIFRSGHDGAFGITLILEEENYGQIAFESFSTSVYDHSEFEAPKASLLGNYSDATVDTNGNGLFDILTIEAEFSVDSSGDYQVRGWMEDSLGGAIDLVDASVSLTPGSHMVQLNFDGRRVREHEVDGPYLLRYVTIHDENSVLLDGQRDAHVTAAYSYLDFDSPEAPLVVLTGNFQDSAEDTNFNGLFDHLTVAVEVTCRDSGYVIAEGRLIAPSGEEIMWTSNFAQVAADVPSNVELNFDGRYIFGNLEDGPFYLKDLLVYHTGDPSQSVFLTEACTTAVYSCSNFEPSAVITGKVTDVHDDSIPNVLLSIEGVDYDYTNAAGRYNLIILQNDTCTVEIDVPPQYEADSTSIFVNGEYVGGGTSVEVEVTVDSIIQVDFKFEPSTGININPDAENNPWMYGLRQNYPNPFNPETIIEYTLSKGCQVKIVIYNTLGRKVRSLLDGYQSPRNKKVYWNGRDDNGNEVASGIYFYRLHSGDFSQTKKMVLLR